jgi:predicted Zn-dependent peptidase
MSHDVDASRLSVLPNGIRVISEAMPRVHTLAVGAWVDVGARYEPAEANGVAHLLEHMAFKGTATRSAKAIAEEIESVGGSLNAYTSRDHTAYYARALADDLPLAVDLIGDILQRSTIEPEELEKERHVVLQEIGQVNDTPDDLIGDLFQAAAYPDQPMGRSILGPEAIVAGMSREALLGYMHRHYAPARIVVAAAGKVEHERLVDLVGEAFRDLPPRPPEPPEPARYGGGRHLDRRKDLEQVHLCAGVEAFSHADPDHFALLVFSTALGGGMSSRLFQEARENRGLCYSIGTFTASHADTGLLGIDAGTAAADVPELVRVIESEAAALAAHPDPGEIRRAKAQLKAGLLMSLESCHAVCSELALQLLCFGRRMPTAEVLAKLDAVDEAAIRRVGRRLFGEGRPVTLAAIGPLKRLPEIRLGA